jgi:surfeit locus 1 family protein
LLAALLGRWRWLTLAALLSCALMVWLGFWQLGRLAQRRVVNEQLASRPGAPPVTIDAAFVAAVPTEEALRQLEYRTVVVRGRWEYDRERVIPNQLWERQLGLHLVTPLVIAGTEGAERTVLVDRGWIPADAADPGKWGQFRDRATEGQVVEVRGSLRVDPRTLGQLIRRGERRPLPLYVVQAPPPSAATDPGAQPLPYKRPLVASIGEGVHAIAAMQWFAIGAIILIGLVVYVSQQERQGVRSQVRFNPALASARRAS